MIRRDLDSATHVILELLDVVDDLHCAAAQHVGWAHHDRVADTLSTVDGLLQVRDAAGLRTRDMRLVQHLVEALTILGAIDIIDRCTEDLDAGLLQRRREVDGRLAAELHDNALGLLLVDDVQYIFRRQRLEVEAVGNIEVGRNRLRVVVDDDGLDAHFPQGPYRMHGAVVKLHPLADADWTGAQYDDLALMRDLDLILLRMER